MELVEVQRIGAGAAISVGSQMRAETTKRVKPNTNTTKAISRAARQEVMGQRRFSLFRPQPSSAQDAALEAGRALPEEAHC